MFDFSNYTFTIYILIPFIFLLKILIFKDKSKLTCLLEFCLSGLYYFFIYFTARWDLYSVFGKYLLIFGIILIIIITAKDLFYKQPFLPVLKIGWFYNFFLIALIVVFNFFNTQVINGLKPIVRELPDYELQFPLKNGNYYISQGGSHYFLNNYAKNTAQRYKICLTKLNSTGQRALGLYPQICSNYYIFKENIFCPVDGKVVKAVDGMRDFNPPEKDEYYEDGNYIIIAFQDYYLKINHLLRGSIQFKSGDDVQKGQYLAQVGNSGANTEPQLCMEIYKNSENEVISQPIYFYNKFSVRNRIIKINE